jgi:hypothetical protein
LNQCHCSVWKRHDTLCSPIALAYPGGFIKEVPIRWRLPFAGEPKSNRFIRQLSSIPNRLCSSALPRVTLISSTSTPITSQYWLDLIHNHERRISKLGQSQILRKVDIQHALKAAQNVKFTLNGVMEGIGWVRMGKIETASNGLGWRLKHPLDTLRESLKNWLNRVEGALRVS